MSDYICEELIFEIFTRLPPKSLLRFRALSKSICSYINTPDFIRLHTLRSSQKLMIRHEVPDNEIFYTIHSKDEVPRRGYTGTTPLEFSYRYIVGSCNGIICVVDWVNHIIIWNPSIRRKLTVPHPPMRYINRALGFGFDPITNDYKIVCIPKYSRYSSKRDSFVYAIKTGYWCEISPPDVSIFESLYGCFFNGALHWVVTSYGKDKHYILTFDLSTHVFGKIELSEPSWEIRNATTIQGSLAVISNRQDGDSWIWVMKEYNNTASWSVVFKLKANEVKGRLRRVLQLTNNGDLLFSSSYEEGFKVYDPKIGSLSRLQNFNEDCYIVDMEMYVESLQLFDMKGMEACGGNRLSILGGEKGKQKT